MKPQRIQVTHIPTLTLTGPKTWHYQATCQHCHLRLTPLTRLHTWAEAITIANNHAGYHTQEAPC